MPATLSGPGSRKAKLIGEMTAKYGGQFLDAHQTPYSVIRAVLEGGTLRDGMDAEIVPGTPHECHANASEYWMTHPESLLFTGFARRGGFWVDHSWIVEGGRIIETTAERDEYLGVPLDGKDALFFVGGNMGYDQFEKVRNGMTEEARKARGV